VHSVEDLVPRTENRERINRERVEKAEKDHRKQITGNGYSPVK
jgi:hypothetical protein